MSYGYSGRTNTADEDDALIRAAQLRRRIETEAQEFDRQKREIEQARELMAEQRSQFNRTLWRLGDQASGMLQASDTDASRRESLSSLSSIINECEDCGKRLERRSEERLEGVRESVGRAYQSRVRQLEDESRD